MIYHGTRSYPGRWLVKLIEAALIAGIVFFSIDALLNLFLPRDGIVFETTWVEPVEVQIIPFSRDESELRQYEYFDLAFDHQLSGQYYDAVMDYTRALEIDPYLYGAYLNRGVAYEQLGRTSYAIQDFNQYMNRPGVTIYTDDSLYEGGGTQVTMSEAVVYEFVFPARAGQTIIASASAIESNSVDPLIVLVNENGEAVNAGDDMLHQGGTLLSMDAYIQSHRVMQSGLYTLRVSHAGGGSYGDVLVRLQVHND